MLPNGLQYTRDWMTKIIGLDMVQTMFEFANKFNSLGLTQEEHALIFPAVICVKGFSNDEKRRRFYSLIDVFRWNIERSRNCSKYSMWFSLRTLHTNVNNTYTIACQSDLSQFTSSNSSWTRSNSIRDFLFSKIFAYLPLLNDLQEKKVGALVPPSKFSFSLRFFVVQFHMHRITSLLFHAHS